MYLIPSSTCTTLAHFPVIHHFFMAEISTPLSLRRHRLLSHPLPSTPVPWLQCHPPHHNRTPLVMILTVIGHRQLPTTPSVLSLSLTAATIRFVFEPHSVTVHHLSPHLNYFSSTAPRMYPSPWNQSWFTWTLKHLYHFFSYHPLQSIPRDP